MSEKIIFIGTGLIFLGILFLIIGSFVGTSKSNTNVAIGGFIGPIPFGFFTSKNMFWIWLLILGIFLLLWFLLRKTL